MYFLADTMKYFAMITYTIFLLLIAYLFLKDLGLIRFQLKLPLLPNNGFDPKPHNLECDYDDSKKAKSNLSLLAKISIFVVISRMFIFVFAYILQTILSGQSNGFFTSFEFTWNRWDSPHYVYLSEHWYTNTGDAANFIVFYPLYPILVKLAAVILFTNNYFAVGVIVSNICLIFACFFLYKLIEFEFGGSFSGASVRYLLIAPFSFFFGIAFTESLFLMLTIMFFYYMRKGMWLEAGILGFLAAVTKNQGLLLIVPACMEFLTGFDTELSYMKNRAKRAVAYFLKNGLYIALIPAGFFLYLFLNRLVTGGWFTFIKYQKEHWFNSAAFFANTLKYLVINAFTWSTSASYSLALPQIFMFLFATVMIFFSFKRLPLSYTGFMLAYTIISYSISWPLSTERYITALFPIYLLLGMVSKKKKTDWLFSIVSILLLCFYTWAFMTGKPVM